MFYSTEVLGRRGRFGLVWLLATRGDKRRLGAKEVEAFNVAEGASALVAAIPQGADGPGAQRKFSLYLSSQLTLGLVLLLDRQTDALLRASLHLERQLCFPLSFHLKAEKRKGPKDTSASNDKTPANEFSEDLPLYASPTGAEFLDGLQQATDDIAASSADPSGGTLQNIPRGPHQARIDDITMRDDDVFRPVRQHRDMDMDLPPMDDTMVSDILKDTPQGRAVLRQGEELRSQSRGPTPVPKGSDATDVTPPDAPPRSLTPPPGQAMDQTEAGRAEPALPSLAVHLDDADQLPQAPKRPRRDPAQGRPARHRPVEAKKAEKSIQLNSEHMKNNQLSYTDLVFADEAARSKHLQQQAEQEGKKPDRAAGELKRRLFSTESFVPISFQLELLGRRDGRSARAGVFRDEALRGWNGGLLGTIRAAAGPSQQGEAPRGLEDVNQENPFQLHDPDDLTLAAERLELGGQATEAQLSAELLDLAIDGTAIDGTAADGTAMDGMVGDREVGRAEKSSVLEGGRPSSGLGLGRPSSVMREDFPLAVVEEETEETERRGLAAVLAAVEEACVREGREETDFGTFCPPTKTRPEASRAFHGLLCLLKAAHVTARQDQPFGPIQVNLVPDL